MAEGRIVLQMDELQEAVAVFAQWERRRHELPEQIRLELEALIRTDPADLVQVTMIGGLVAEVVLVPRIRALVGNLRARGSQQTYPELRD